MSSGPAALCCTRQSRGRGPGPNELPRKVFRDYVELVMIYRGCYDGSLDNDPQR